MERDYSISLAAEEPKGVYGGNLKNFILTKTDEIQITLFDTKTEGA